MIENIISSMARVAGYGRVRCYGEKNLVMTLDDIGQPRVVLSEKLKDIHGYRYGFMDCLSKR